MKKTKKFCPDCGRNLPLSAFQRNASRGDGLQVYCGDCQNIRNAKNSYRHPEKDHARAKVRAAIRSGELKRPAHCLACMATGKLDAHHEDYGEPLEVVWLCRSCHQKAHQGSL